MDMLSVKNKLTTKFAFMKLSARIFSILFVFTALNSLNSWGQDSSFNVLNTVVVSSSKTKEKRVESPIAISVINYKSIKTQNPTRIDYLLNQVSGVYMPSIGNEQHMMSIRQPISLKGLYLYLEDGMPIRTSGLFSNNALIEINTANIQQIEILKGPASALYGAEAIGGVIHFITEPTPKENTIQLNSQINSMGLLQTGLKLGMPYQKGGWLIHINYSNQKNGPIEYSDYQKKAISIRHDFIINNKWSGFQSIQFVNYDAQMTGSLDSTHFYSHNFSSLQTFTYRKINALRFRQNLNYNWGANNNTYLNFMYRNNKMDQNPTYSIASTNITTKFKGQTNSNEFNSFVLDLQQVIQLPKLNSKIIIGSSSDFTNQALIAHYIDIYKDTLLGKYTNYSYPVKDSFLTNYTTQIWNQASYFNIITDFSKHLKSNLALRYDYFEYIFKNTLPNGTPSSNNYFRQFTPKLGITYHKEKWGGYINYGLGFVPPQITELYNAIRVPYLLPQSFSNKELGIWFQQTKWYAEFSFYEMLGENEIVSVRQLDGVNLNQNTGATKHYGMEYQIKYQPLNYIEINWNGTYAKHLYINTNIKGVDVNGNEMSAAPNYWSTLTCLFKMTSKINTQLEWQHQSKYYIDETNATVYPGFDVMNVRVNYNLKQGALWLHVLNLNQTYYSTMATKNFSVKGNAAYSFYIGEPRSISIGWNWSIR
jgi:outer membrane receptor for Fe3+-dicitrate